MLLDGTIFCGLVDVACGILRRLAMLSEAGLATASPLTTENDVTDLTLAVGTVQKFETSITMFPIIPSFCNLECHRHDTEQSGKVEPSPDELTVLRTLTKSEIGFFIQSKHLRVVFLSDHFNSLMMDGYELCLASMKLGS